MVKPESRKGSFERDMVGAGDPGGLLASSVEIKPDSNLRYIRTWL